jgi:hypothetical protein
MGIASCARKNGETTKLEKPAPKQKYQTQGVFGGVSMAQSTLSLYPVLFRW